MILISEAEKTGQQIGKDKNKYMSNKDMRSNILFNCTYLEKKSHFIYE
jgi:hypothetical protein